MIRRQARLRREYLYRKNIEERQRTIQENKAKVKKALDNSHILPSVLRKDALQLAEKTDWDDEGGQGIVTHEDDEYRWAGVEDPNIVITTSRDPSAKLKQFAKELKLVFPNSHRINRGGYEMSTLMEWCRSKNVTDFIQVHEHRGQPDTLIISHLPYGPTAMFSLSNVIMRHDVPNMGTLSQQYPHLVFHNFKSRLGNRVMNILKYLFPVPKEDSRRVITFANQDDFVSFRHHTYKKEDGKNFVLEEVGPRMEMKLYSIKLGTVENLDAADTEWQLKPYMNTSKKRRYLSDDPGLLTKSATET